MPYIHIRLSACLDDNQRLKLFEKTTALMHAVMGKRQEVTVVQIQESDAKQWAVNGKVLSPADASEAYVDIKVTDGTNSSEEKAEMIAATVDMLNDVVGVMQEACYVVIDCIPANSWGYSGKTQAARSSLAV